MEQLILLYAKPAPLGHLMQKLKAQHVYAKMASTRQPETSRMQSVRYAHKAQILLTSKDKKYVSAQQTQKCANAQRGPP